MYAVLRHYIVPELTEEVEDTALVGIYSTKELADAAEANDMFTTYYELSSGHTRVGDEWLIVDWEEGATQFAQEELMDRWRWTIKDVVLNK